MRFVPHALLALLLTMALAVALATRFPQAPLLERAEGWALVGPLVADFRRAYLPPPAAAGSGGEPGDESPGFSPPPAAEVEIVRIIDPDMVGPKPKVWARPGTPIYAEADVASREVGRVEHLFPLSRLERRGDWFRVRYGTRLSGFHKGWVHLPDYREPTPEEINAPAPVLPLAPVALDPEAGDRARAHLGEPIVDGTCGPFRLLTDVRSAETLAMCERVGARIEAVHRRRYGLELVGEAAETILLFADQEAFYSFRDEVSAPPGDAFASAARGLVAVPAGGRLPAAVEASLVHELTHLLNRRSLGPALPPWLDEGMARHLDTLGVGVGARTPRSAAGVAPAQPLEHLFALDRAAFQMRADRNYRSAGRWIAYLVDGPDASLAEGMKGFLTAVAGGEPIAADLLLGHLGRDWPELEDGFRAWERGEPRLATD